MIPASIRAEQRRNVALPSSASADEYKVKVLPVFFVPAGEKDPSPEQDQKLMRHLQWAQERYRELLQGKDTFELAANKAAVYKAEHPLDFYRSAPEGAAPQFLSELLEHFKTNRFDAPFVFLILVLNPRDKFPNGGGTPDQRRP